MMELIFYLIIFGKLLSIDCVIY